MIAGSLATQAAESKGGFGRDRRHRVAGGSGKRPDGGGVATLAKGKGGLPPNGGIWILEQRTQVRRYLRWPEAREGESGALANGSRGMRQEWIELGRLLRRPELGAENERQRAVGGDDLRIGRRRRRRGGGAPRLLGLGHGGRGVERWNGGQDQEGKSDCDCRGPLAHGREPNKQRRAQVDSTYALQLLFAVRPGGSLASPWKRR